MSPSVQVELSPLKLWCFRFGALLLVPLLVLGGVELGLRLAGYGYPTGFFKPIRIGTDDYLVENDKFGLRFFPPALARSPAPVKMKAKKPAGTYRIFILGESAALGDPRPAYGAGRYLQTLLRERFPGQQFEVVCVAMTAINSHAVLSIAQECTRQEGDLWIVYMGNNEMVGPFGAATIFGARAPPRWLVRLHLAIQQTRVGQLLAAVGQKLSRSASSPPGWGGMEMFTKSRLAPDDHRKDRVYRSFERNLQDIVRLGLGSGATVVLSTVAVNLRDCPPFASLGRADLSAVARAASDKLSVEASAAERQGNFAQAATLYNQAASLQPDFAELQFRLGDCLLRLTNVAVARQHFQRACDDDALPFRADSRINRLITQVGEHSAGPHLALLDAVALFSTNSAAVVPGQEWFYEHVHFNFDGNYRLARAWAQQVEGFLPRALTEGVASRWASQATCERRLGLTDYNRSAVMEDVIRRLRQPPFTGQLNNTQRLASAQSSLRDIRERMDTNAAVAARELYQEALAHSPDDHRLHENFAEFLEAVGELQQAAAEWQRVSELIPHHHLAYFQTGRLLALQRKPAEAESALRVALKLRPDLSEGWFELGNLHAAEGKLEQALQEFARSRRLIPEDYRIYHHMGQALSKLSRRAEAIQNFRQALRLRPGYWQARYSLAEELAFDGQTQEALRQFEQVLRLKPDHAMAHLNLGVALFKLGRMDEAKQQFAQALRLNPDNRLAVDYLRQLQNVADPKP